MGKFTDGSRTVTLLDEGNQLTVEDEAWGKCERLAFTTGHVEVLLPRVKAREIPEARQDARTDSSEASNRIYEAVAADSGVMISICLTPVVCGYCYNDTFNYRYNIE